MCIGMNMVLMEYDKIDFFEKYFNALSKKLIFKHVCSSIILLYYGYEYNGLNQNIIQSTLGISNLHNSKSLIISRTNKISLQTH